MLVYIIIQNLFCDLKLLELLGIVLKALFFIKQMKSTIKHQIVFFKRFVEKHKVGNKNATK